MKYLNYPAYLFQENINTEALHGTPTFEVPFKPFYYTFLVLKVIIDAVF